MITRTHTRQSHFPQQPSWLRLAAGVLLACRGPSGELSAPPSIHSIPIISSYAAHGIYTIYIRLDMISREVDLCLLEIDNGSLN